MLNEIHHVRQVPGERRRRWFFDKEMDLTVWFSDDASIVGFQLVYGRPMDPHALTWWRDTLREVKPGMTVGLQRWFDDAAGLHDRDRGFDVARALDAAMEMSAGQLPVFITCGALNPHHKAACPASGPCSTAKIVEQISAAQQEVAAKRRRCESTHWTITSYALDCLARLFCSHVQTCSDLSANSRIFPCNLKHSRAFAVQNPADTHD